LNVFAGAGIDSEETGFLAGGSLGWELTPTFGIEGTGYWLDRGAGAEGFAAALRALVGLGGSRPVVPFVEAGVGLYRATYDPAQSTIPEFYQIRIDEEAQGGPLRASYTFTDPSFAFGGGLNVFVSRHIAIRPDVETMIVWHDSDAYFITAIAVRLTYHFESHPVTPSRR
jgi:hypothetical protein